MTPALGGLDEQTVLDVRFNDDSDLVPDMYSMGSLWELCESAGPVRGDSWLSIVKAPGGMRVRDSKSGGYSKVKAIYRASDQGDWYELGLVRLERGMNVGQARPRGVDATLFATASQALSTSHGLMRVDELTGGELVRAGMIESGAGESWLVRDASFVGTRSRPSFAIETDSRSYDAGEVRCRFARPTGADGAPVKPSRMREASEPEEPVPDRRHALKVILAIIIAVFIGFPLALTVERVIAPWDSELAYDTVQGDDGQSHAEAIVARTAKGANAKEVDGLLVQAGVGYDRIAQLSYFSDGNSQRKTVVILFKGNETPYPFLKSAANALEAGGYDCEIPGSFLFSPSLALTSDKVDAPVERIEFINGSQYDGM